MNASGFLKVPVVAICAMGLLYMGCESSSSLTPSSNREAETPVAVVAETPSAAQEQAAAPVPAVTPTVRVAKVEEAKPAPVRPTPPAPRPPAARPTPTPPVPRSDDAGLLVVDKTTHDFGRLNPKQKVSVDFILSNNGQETVEIDKPVRSSCGCTVGQLKSYVLPPGESVPLTVSYTPKDRPGKYTQRAWVTTKSPSKPEKLTMTITAEVIRHITVFPAILKLEVREEGKHQTVVLESAVGQEFSVIGATSTRNVAAVAYDKTIKASHHEVPIEIDLDKLRAGGATRGYVNILVDHPKVKTINVQYTVTRPFVAKPRMRYLRRVKAGEAIRSDVTVVSSYGEDFELETVTSEKGYVTVSNTTRTEDGYKIEFTLNVPAEQKKGVIQDYLLIKIKDRPQDILKVSVYGRAG